MNVELSTNKEGVEFIECDGTRHALGLLPSTYTLPCRPAADVMGVLSRDELIKIVESDDWQFGREHFDGEWTKDQNGWGKCASSAATYAVEKAAYLRGMGRLDLSDDYLYSLVNDGRDRGSTLSENMEAIMTRGIAPRSLVAPGEIYRRKYDTAAADRAAKRFLAWEPYAINSEAELATAIVNRALVVIAIHVGNRWRKFDRRGVLIGDRGMGNHCEHLDDVRYNREDGVLEYRKHSSHGRSYGEDGFCWVRYDKHLATVHHSHQKYAVAGVKDDPLGDNPNGGEQQDQQDDEPAILLEAAGSGNCHWCHKWDAEERPRVLAAGVEIKINQQLPGRGVPRFRLSVANESIDHKGYWSSSQILASAAELQASVRRA